MSRHLSFARPSHPATNPRNIGRFLLVLCFTIVWGGAQDARAQDCMFWFETGKHESSFANGRTEGGAGLGAGFLFTIGGGADKTTGLVVPVGVEFKGNWGTGMDTVGTIDIAARIHSVSFGPGANFGFMSRSTADDPRCVTGPFTAKSSCFKDGTRDIGGFVALGLSAYAKVNVGPQGRGFVQVRYIFYPQPTMTVLSVSEMAAAFNQFSSSVSPTSAAINDAAPHVQAVHPDDFPEFDNGRDVRVSAGYVFGGGDSKAKVLRVQYLDKKFNLTHVLANTNGMFDQHTKQISVGVGFAF
jgi:hypothetical protein